MILSNITLGKAGLYALLGYAIVFFGLILLMLVVVLLGKFFTLKAKKPQPAQEIPTSVPAQKQSAAPGTAGQLKLYNVDPKTAAMLMAIVANKMGKPLCELRFLSIQEVSE